MGYKGVYRDAASELGQQIGQRKWSLVYGGANVGLMKVLAETAMSNGAHVTGVMPHLLIKKEVAHQGIHHMHPVERMSERKELMVEISDAFIAMPGGFGTLDELAEILTLNQLRIVDKPLALLNTNGYFDALLKFLDHGVAEGFIREEHRNNILVAEKPSVLLDNLDHFKPVETAKWIETIKNESQ